VNTRQLIWTLVAALSLQACGSDTDTPGAAVSQAASSEPVDVSLKGPHAVATYKEGLLDPTYADAIVYYPTDLSAPAVGVAFCPGWLGDLTQLTWWGETLASHGIITMITTPLSVVADQPPERAEDLTAAIRVLRAEASRDGSPIRGKLDTAHIGLMGHSMGGGGSLLAADTLGDQVQAIIPITPWQPSGVFGKVSAPTLILAAESDSIAPVASHAYPHFESLPSGTARVYAEVAQADHLMPLNESTNGSKHEVQARYAIAWLKLHLTGDARYQTFVNGAEHDKDKALFSRYIVLP
jgi:triacylglycerol lipase